MTAESDFVPTCGFCGIIANDTSKERCSYGFSCPLKIEVREDCQLNGELYDRHFTEEGIALSAADTVPHKIE